MNPNTVVYSAVLVLDIWRQLVLSIYSNISESAINLSVTELPDKTLQHRTLCVRWPWHQQEHQPTERTFEKLGNIESLPPLSAS